MSDYLCESTDKKYQTWFSEVNSEVEKIAGLSVTDLPDIEFRVLYEDEATPYEAAVEVLVYAGFPRELL